MMVNVYENNPSNIQLFVSASNVLPSQKASYLDQMTIPYLHYYTRGVYKLFYKYSNYDGFEPSLL